MFSVDIFDNDGLKYSIGNIKIGFKDQDISTPTYKKIQKLFNNNIFDSLPSSFFSIGQDVDFYINLFKLPNEIKENFLKSLNDIIYNTQLFNVVQNEHVFNTSLMRGITETIIEQFKRVLDGKSPLSDFKFYFIKKEQDDIGSIKLQFNVYANSTPSTNIHAIIGKNGVGKTTLLNRMILSFINKSDNNEGFYQDSLVLNQYKKIKDDYFSHLIAVSFSIFDPFIPNKKEFKNYSYIGLKESESKLKEPKTYFQNDFLVAFYECMSFSAKKSRWLHAIKNLESDYNFCERKLSSLIDREENEHDDEYEKRILESIHNLSSGHASVLLIITQLVAKVKEKTLVLIDEPETHLHPPLLSAFIRTLSDLLDNRNGVAIIATHSPVVLQEIPKSCVLKIERTGKIIEAFRLNIETFGENVGVLTREVFGLEVLNSGFYNLLTKKVETGKKYNEIIDEFNEQLGTEARILLKMLVRHRDTKD
ncbi:AAA family ATPase [Gallibacterium genomosp. 2]|nr:AAA family ATPase [Gallibacterium genomosp. 2]